jgi:flagellar basal-body rod modification protein FlgD
VEDGIYRYVVKALDETGQKIEVDYRTTGKVTGLEFESGQAMVRVDKYIDVGVSDIVRVSDLGAGAATAASTDQATDQATDSDQENN